MKRAYSVLVTYIAHSDTNAEDIRAEMVGVLEARYDWVDVSEKAVVAAPEIPEDESVRL